MIVWCRECDENWLQTLGDWADACPCTYRGSMETMTLKEFFAYRNRGREFNTVDLKQLREDRCKMYSHMHWRHDELGY